MYVLQHRVPAAPAGRTTRLRRNIPRRNIPRRKLPPAHDPTRTPPARPRPAAHPLRHLRTRLRNNPPHPAGPATTGDDERQVAAARGTVLIWHGLANSVPAALTAVHVQKTKDHG